jgi:uncharacterized membrane protein (UPF0136 family)
MSDSNTHQPDQPHPDPLPDFSSSRSENYERYASKQKRLRILYIAGAILGLSLFIDGALTPQNRPLILYIAGAVLVLFLFIDSARTEKTRRRILYIAGAILGVFFPIDGVRYQQKRMHGLYIVGAILGLFIVIEGVRIHPLLRDAHVQSAPAEQPSRTPVPEAAPPSGAPAK